MCLFFMSALFSLFATLSLEIAMTIEKDRSHVRVYQRIEATTDISVLITSGNLVVMKVNRNAI